MSDQETRQTIMDEEHLRLLSIGYYVSAGITAIFSMIGLLYFAMGVFFLAIGRSGSASGAPGELPPAFMGALFMGMGLVMFAFLAIIAVLKFLAGSRIKQRRSRIFCMIIAGIGCLEIPYGTALGVLTFMVLGRNSVRSIFEAAKTSLSNQTKLDIPE
jgi:hypothetical protein